MRHDNPDASVVVARNPIEEPFGADNEEGADLIVEADLATANERAAGIGAETQPVSVSVMLKFSQPAPMLGPI